MHVPFLYRDKPVFGLDVGQSSAKVVQLAAGKTPKVEGYGFVEFNENYSIDVNFTQNRAFVFSVSDSDQDITVQNESDKPISFYVKAYHRVYGSEGISNN